MKIIFDGKNAVTALFAEAMPGSKKLISVWNSLRSYRNTAYAAPLTAVDGKIEKIETKQLYYGCRCTKRSVKRTLMTLSEEDRKELGNEAEVICRYCGKKYIVNPNE